MFSFSPFLLGKKSSICNAQIHVYHTDIWRASHDTVNSNCLQKMELEGKRNEGGDLVYALYIA